MSARTGQDWILWAQLGCALVATAHAEYTLVTALGQHWLVAGAVTGALDLYVVRALQKHKDVLPAVLVMVAANVTSILIGARVVPVHWAVLGAVGALAPLLVWRGHRLRVHEMRTGTPALGTVPEGVPVQVSESGAVSAPVPEDVPAAGPCTRPAPFGVRFTDRCDECGYAYGVHPLPVPEGVPGFHLDGCDGQCQGLGPVACIQRRDGVPDDGWTAKSLVHLHAPDHVPADWAQPGTYPPLAPVPDLPDEYAGSAVHSDVLEPSDWAYLERASEYVHGCTDAKRKPSIRGMRKALSIGQDRAERLLEHLGVEP